MKPWRSLAWALALLVTPIAGAEPLSFALIGDTPYTPLERRLLPQLLAEIAASGAEFIVHVGDIKDGHSRCSDEVFIDRRDAFDASPVPFVFVPGDNEWTDCRRASNGSYDPLERLERLRSLFFSAPVSLGLRRLALERQAGTYAEHVRWQSGPVLFVGLNVPGGDNNRGPKSVPSAEFRQRMPQVMVWLKQAFAQARSQKLRGIVIAMQANPKIELLSRGVTDGAFRELLETLRAETLAFAGDVVLVHGDTHSQRIDQPLRDPKTGKTIANFTRVETYGWPFMGWVRASIDPQGNPLFRFEARRFPTQPASNQP